MRKTAASSESSSSNGITPGLLIVSLVSTSLAMGCYPSRGNYELGADIETGSLEVIRSRITQDNVNERIQTGSSGAFYTYPLSIACKRGDAAIVEYLLSLGADASAVDDQGKSAMFWLVSGEFQDDRWRIMQLLIEAGVSLNEHEPQAGLTPLMYAIDLGRPEVAKDLLRAGASLTPTDITGRTALDHIPPDASWADELRSFARERARTRGGGGRKGAEEKEKEE